MNSIDSIFSTQKILPIIQADTVEQGVHVAKAMQSAGMSVVEVVLRNDTALDLAYELKTALPELTVGIGTVYNVDLLSKALDTGADFIVTPATSASLTQALIASGKPFLPGVSSLADVVQLLELGITRMKLFPAEVVGGQAMLKAISAVFADVKFCPTGGVNAKNLSEYLALPNVFAAGGTWMVPKKAVLEGNWPSIRSACEEALALSNC